MTTSACLVVSAPLVSLLMLTMSSEVKERGEAIKTLPLRANDDSKRLEKLFFFGQDEEMNRFQGFSFVEAHLYNAQLNKQYINIANDCEVLTVLS